MRFLVARDALRQTHRGDDGRIVAFGDDIRPISKPGRGQSLAERGAAVEPRRTSPDEHRMVPLQHVHARDIQHQVTRPAEGPETFARAPPPPSASSSA